MSVSLKIPKRQVYAAAFEAETEGEREERKVQILITIGLNFMRIISLLYVLYHWIGTISYIVAIDQSYGQSYL
jgi:hypothetical protein